MVTWKIFILSIFSTMFLLAGTTYAHCYDSSVSPTSGSETTEFKFCASTNARPKLYVDGIFKGWMIAASRGECPNNYGLEYTLVLSDFEAGSHEYLVETGHGRCTGSFQVSSTSGKTTNEITKTCSCSLSECSCEMTFDGITDYDSVKVDVSVRGDFGYFREYASIFADGSLLGEICKYGCYDSCTMDMGKKTFDVTSYAYDGTVNIKCVSTALVNYAPSTCSGTYMECKATLKITSATISDTTPPTVTVTGAPTDWVNSDQTASIDCTDASGCDPASYKVKIYNSQPNSCPTDYEEYTSEVPYSVSSHVWVCGAAKDVNGNEGFSSPIEFKIDKTPPIAGVSDAPSDWVNSDQTALVSCSDSLSGCERTTYGYKVLNSFQACPSDKSEYTLGERVTITEHKWVCSYVEDMAGNSDVSDSVEFKIDKTPPEITVSHNPIAITEETDVTIKAEATDALSGLEEIKIFVDNYLKNTCTSSQCLYTSKYSGGVHRYYAEASDKAGNTAQSPIQEFKVKMPEVITIKSGWNLVSVSYKTFEFVSSTCNLEKRNFYHYNPILETKWEIVRDVNSIEGGKGYWFYSTNPCEIKVLVEDDTKVVSSDITLSTGWNHIGSTGSGSSFNSIKGGCTIERILYYNPVTGNWEPKSETDNMEKHKSYFVKASC